MIEIVFGTRTDIDMWMELVQKVRWNFPGLETEQALQEHRETVLEFMDEGQEICAKNDGSIVGVLLFSRKLNMLCCLAVDARYRRQHIASSMFEKVLSIADPDRDLTVSTFREGDPKGIAPRRFYQKHGFREGELIEEYQYPCQIFVRPANLDRNVIERGESCAD